MTVRHQSEAKVNRRILEVQVLPNCEVEGTFSVNNILRFFGRVRYNVRHQEQYRPEPRLHHVEWDTGRIPYLLQIWKLVGFLSVRFYVTADHNKCSGFLSLDWLSDFMLEWWELHIGTWTGGACL